MAQGPRLVSDGVRTFHIGIGIDGMDYNPYYPGKSGDNLGSADS